jgi:hypothetical protein
MDERHQGFSSITRFETAARCFDVELMPAGSVRFGYPGWLLAQSDRHRSSIRRLDRYACSRPIQKGNPR